MKASTLEEVNRDVPNIYRKHSVNYLVNRNYFSNIGALFLAQTSQDLIKELKGDQKKTIVHTYVVCGYLVHQGCIYLIVFIFI